MDEKLGLPLDVFSSLATKEDILTEMIRWKSVPCIPSSSKVY